MAKQSKGEKPTIEASAPEKRLGTGKASRKKPKDSSLPVVDHGPLLLLVGFFDPEGFCKNRAPQDYVVRKFPKVKAQAS